LIIQCLSGPLGAGLKEFFCNYITVFFDVMPLLFLGWGENEAYRGLGLKPGPPCVGFLVDRVALGQVYL
jgi:hypothetical protein